MTTTRHRVVVNEVRRRVSRNDHFLGVANTVTCSRSNANSPAIPHMDVHPFGDQRRGFTRAAGAEQREALAGRERWNDTSFTAPRRHEPAGQVRGPEHGILYLKGPCSGVNRLRWLPDRRVDGPVLTPFSHRRRLGARPASLRWSTRRGSASRGGRGGLGQSFICRTGGLERAQQIAVVRTLLCPARDYGRDGRVFRLSSNGCGWVEARSAGRRGVLAARVASELTAHGVHLTGGGRGAPWPGVGRSGVAAGRPACQRATRVLRCATALRVTHRPSLRSSSRYGPCGPAWTGASRPSTTTRKARRLAVRG